MMHILGDNGLQLKYMYYDVTLHSINIDNCYMLIKIKCIQK